MTGTLKIKCTENETKQMIVVDCDLRGSKAESLSVVLAVCEALKIADETELLLLGPALLTHKAKLEASMFKVDLGGD